MEFIFANILSFTLTKYKYDTEVSDKRPFEYY